MKKIYSLALVLALLLSLSTPALAEENSTTLGNLGNTDISVNAVYEEGIEGSTIYSIDISWENMSFAYKGKSEDTWNPNEHKYNNTSAEAHWLESDAKITVLNHSNAFLTLECGYTAEEGFDTVDMQFTYSQYAPQKSFGLVNSAELDLQAVESIINVSPLGILPENTPAGTTIGNITLTIAQWTEPTVEDAEEFVATESETLSAFAETLYEDDLYINAYAAVGDLEIAIGNAKDAETRETYAAMVEAYLNAYAVMAEFNTLHPEPPTT